MGCGVWPDWCCGCNPGLCDVMEDQRPLQTRQDMTSQLVLSTKGLVCEAVGCSDFSLECAVFWPLKPVTCRTVILSVASVSRNVMKKKDSHAQSFMPVYLCSTCLNRFLPKAWLTASVLLRSGLWVYLFISSFCCYLHLYSIFFTFFP